MSHIWTDKPELCVLLQGQLPWGEKHHKHLRAQWQSYQPHWKKTCYLNLISLQAKQQPAVTWGFQRACKHTGCVNTWTEIANYADFWWAYQPKEWPVNCLLTFWTNILRWFSYQSITSIQIHAGWYLTPEMETWELKSRGISWWTLFVMTCCWQAGQEGMFDPEQITLGENRGR